MKEFEKDKGLVLIADGGSTRTDWGLACGSDLVMRLSSAGMNPYFQTAAEMEAILKASVLPELGDRRIESLYFYGAGCGSAAKNAAMAACMAACFNAPAQVESDMLGAARGLLGMRRGIACILGTGSNSCLYDGRGIIDQVPAMGFILGDEGSGASLGKLLLGEHFKRNLSVRMSARLLTEWGATQADVLEHTYSRPFPSRYLAGFAPFLRENLHEPEIRALVLEAFRSFLERNVLKYAGYAAEPLCFAGSIAYHFADVLRAAARSLSLKIAAIEQSPMEGLARYHAFWRDH
ncbi:MAG: ATPase [Tannerellaceae bacterium]|jgi:N-acetylglucosamine kinase-like BadF-type ATPase|nr:ATPase [Tannerellaceae bacterium]